MALEALILTAVRSGEIRGAAWSEIDLANALWAIPAERMKMGRLHLVPLSSEAITVFERGEIAEAALAHTVSNKVEAAYRRTDFLDKRRLLMRDWSAYCRNLTAL